MIKQTIDQDLKSAMLSGDKQLVATLRTLKGAILDAEIAAGKRDTGLDDVAVIALLQKEVKKRDDAAALYDQGGNAESAEAERIEAATIKEYLPKQLDDAEIITLIEEVIAGYDGELGVQAMGAIINGVKEKAAGAADGATVARLVKARLIQE